MTTIAERTGKLYDLITDITCETYDNNLHIGYWRGLELTTENIPAANDALTDEVISRLNPASGDRLLDIGCGAGAPALRIASRTGTDVTGITVSGRQVEIANAGASSVGLGDRARFMLADATEMPFPDASFNGAWALESMNYMPDQVGFLRQVARVLTPGGRFVVVEVVQDRQPRDAREQEIVDFYQNIWELATVERLDRYPGLFAEAGFELKALDDVSNDVWPGMAVLLTTVRAQRERWLKHIDEAAFNGLLGGMEGIATQTRYVVATAIKS
jgi:cyclopropane fatty-acyl-phospholipid synthase-like methyltransferase